ncbi:MAG: hypothetical protein AAF637_17555 [Pseudomonadota bacterium]
MSLPARDPARVAVVMARIWAGEAFPFHAAAGAWITLAGSGDGSALEIYPEGTNLVAGSVAVSFETGSAPPAIASHVAIETPLGEAELIAIAEREGWLARCCSRGPFSLIELWVENRYLIELLTPEMADDYRRTMTTENWRSWSESD